MDSEIQTSDTKQTQSAPSTVPQVPLGKYTAAAIQKDAEEIQQLQALLQIRATTHNRMTAAIIADAGYDPEKYTQYRLNGNTMILIPKG